LALISAEWPPNDKPYAEGKLKISKQHQQEANLALTVLEKPASRRDLERRLFLVSLWQNFWPKGLNYAREAGYNYKKEPYHRYASYLKEILGFTPPLYKGLG